VPLLIGEGKMMKNNAIIFLSIVGIATMLPTFTVGSSKNGMIPITGYTGTYKRTNVSSKMWVRYE
jgi:Tfp pilus assembly pilus retraction ATPase PilT